MISYEYNYDFSLRNESQISNWIAACADLENHEIGDLNFLFLDDEALHKMNVEFLNHDTLTDVIAFDYTIGKILQGEICISLDRVKENAQEFEVDFETELLRVMIHGVLHFCGYKDKTKIERQFMREKEDFYLSLFAN
jgi:rRNA maturation RNase YbeY